VGSNFLHLKNILSTKKRELMSIGSICIGRKECTQVDKKALGHTLHFCIPCAGVVVFFLAP
jgi:hypothetical protein